MGRGPVVAVMAPPWLLVVGLGGITLGAQLAGGAAQLVGGDVERWTGGGAWWGLFLAIVGALWYLADRSTP